MRRPPRLVEGIWPTIPLTLVVYMIWSVTQRTQFWKSIADHYVRIINSKKSLVTARRRIWWCPSMLPVDTQPVVWLTVDTQHRPKLKYWLHTHTLHTYSFKKSHWKHYRLWRWRRQTFSEEICIISGMLCSKLRSSIILYYTFEDKPYISREQVIDF